MMICEACGTHCNYIAEPLALCDDSACELELEDHRACDSVIVSSNMHQPMEEPQDWETFGKEWIARKVKTRQLAA